MFCCFGQCEITFLKRPFVKGVISGTTYNHILDWRVLEVVKLTFGSYLFLIQSKNHENFDPLPACMWKTSGVEWFCFLNSYSILEISGEQQLFHFITRCKGKSLICFSWLMHARKIKSLFFHLDILDIYCIHKKNQSVSAKVSSYDCRQMRKLEEVLANPWFTKI